MISNDKLTLTRIIDRIPKTDWVKHGQEMCDISLINMDFIHGDIHDLSNKDSI